MGDVDPLAMATWQPGEPVPFSFLVDTFDVSTFHALLRHLMRMWLNYGLNMPQAMVCTRSFAAFVLLHSQLSTFTRYW